MTSALLFVQCWCSFRFGLSNDLFQQVDVVAESFFAGFGQGASGERTPVLKSFGDGNVTGLLEGANVGGQVSIGHTERLAKLGEGQ